MDIFGLARRTGAWFIDLLSATLVPYALYLFLYDVLLPVLSVLSRYIYYNNTGTLPGPFYPGIELGGVGYALNTSLSMPGYMVELFPFAILCWFVLELYTTRTPGRYLLGVRIPDIHRWWRVVGKLMLVFFGYLALIGFSLLVQGAIITPVLLSIPLFWYVYGGLTHPSGMLHERWGGSAHLARPKRADDHTRFVAAAQAALIFVLLHALIAPNLNLIGHGINQLSHALPGLDIQYHPLHRSAFHAFLMVCITVVSLKAYFISPATRS